MDHPPWYQSPLFLVVLGAVLPILISLIGQVRRSRTRRKSEEKITELQEKIAGLEKIAGTYHDVKTRLSGSLVIRDYVQPVLLLGPRNVGKTSLLKAWYAPWDRTAAAASKTVVSSSVPVFDFQEPTRVSHFADPSVTVSAEAHFKLMVHDFPGELDAQQRIIDFAKDATNVLHEQYQLNLGVVLICMLNAQQIATEIGSDTRSYYNGELFATLHDMVATHSVQVERLIVVFNKFDDLRAIFPGKPDEELLRLCSDNFYSNFKHVRGVCNPERMCETLQNLKG